MYLFHKKAKAFTRKAFAGFNGDPVGIRTPNLLGRNEVQYPVMLQGQNLSLQI
tara:strand:- start:797 stop:955 length:159 start_codon:yes stop_codon:yes gene_type:complete